MHTPEGGQHQSVSYDGKIAGLYDLEKTLGSGHFAVVKLARHVFTGEKVAIKVVDKTKLDEVSKAHLFQEVRCMKLVQHPNVVRLYEVIDTQTKLYLILELGDGDLYDYIMKHDGGLSEDLAKKYFSQIVRAISYCHQLHVVHRDLKPANVVFFEKLGVVKLTDFGFSNKFSPGQKLETSCGSLAYSAPEILLGDSYDAPAVDIWSLGVILYMLVCGQPPFEKANDSETLTMIMDCKYSMPCHVTVTCRRLIASMLVRDPEKRATLEQISQDAWLTNNSTTESPVDHLPLVSREQVSEDDHAFIIQKMVNGHIATKEEISQSLDRNKYNHITATYFLLAERRLRQMRKELVQENRPHFFLPSNPVNRFPSINRNVPIDNKLKNDQSNKLMVPVSIEVCNSIEITSEAATEKRNRKCSIVREEDEEDGFSDGRNHCATQERCLDTQYVSKLVFKSRALDGSSGITNTKGELDSLHLDQKAPLDDACKKSQNNFFSKVNSGKSDFPVGLSTQNRAHKKIHPINERQEAGGITEPDLTEVQEDLSGIKDLEISKIRNKNPVLMHRRSKLNKMRTPSCSSSEASDDDTKSKKKKIHKIGGDAPNRFRVHRRDSHDDSSDSQDQATLGSSQSNTHKSLSNSTNEKSSSGKKEEQSKSDDSQNTDSKQKKGSIMENCLPQIGGRIRLRESQSLDRITESQEYEHRQRFNNIIHNYQSSFIVTQSDNMVHDSNNLPEKTWTIDKIISCTDDKISKEPKSRGHKTVCDMNSIEEIDLYIGMNVTKAIQTGSKCSVTMKKIRRLGKYFPVVNLS